MECSKCGFKNKAMDFSFCPSCGSPIVQESQLLKFANKICGLENCRLPAGKLLYLQENICFDKPWVKTCKNPFGSILSCKKAFNLFQAEFYSNHMDKLSLAGCAIVRENKILLLNRKKTGWYELPGGKIDQFETAEIAAKREIKEELSCEVELIRRLGSKDFEENGFTMGYTWFLAEVKEGQMPRISEPEKFDHLKFIPLNELSEYKLSPNMQNFKEELERKRITL